MPSDATITRLSTAMRQFFQTWKRPQFWAAVTDRAGITIDRPSAQILFLVTSRPYHVQELAQQLSIEAPSVTRKTQSLEQAGYIERRTNEKDKRSVVLHPTVLGSMVADRLRTAQLAIFKQALADWSDNDLERFVELFERFTTDTSKTNSLNEEPSHV